MPGSRCIWKQSHWGVAPRHGKTAIFFAKKTRNRRFLTLKKQTAFFFETNWNGLEKNFASCLSICSPLCQNVCLEVYLVSQYVCQKNAAMDIKSKRTKMDEFPSQFPQKMAPKQLVCRSKYGDSESNVSNMFPLIPSISSLQFRFKNTACWCFLRWPCAPCTST